MPGWLVAAATWVSTRPDWAVGGLVSSVGYSSVWIVKQLRRGYRWRRLFVVALIALTALTAMGRLDATLRRMHPQDGENASGGVTSLAKPLVTSSDAEDLRKSWAAWDRTAGDVNDLRTYYKGVAGRDKTTILAGWWLLLDSVVFAPALAYFLSALAWRRRRYFGEVVPGTPASAIARALEASAVLVAPVYLLVDALLENGLTWALVNGRGDAGILGLISLTKMLLIATIALAILVSYLSRPDTTGLRARIWPTMVTLRGPFVAVGLFVLILTQLPTGVRDQLDDVIRQWRVDTGHAVLAAAAVVLLSVLVSVFSRMLLCKKSSAAMRVAASPAFLAVLSTIGVGLAIAAWLTPLRTTVFPIGLLLVGYGVLSLPAYVRALPGERESFEPLSPLAQLVSMLPVVALFLAWLRAEVGVGDWVSWRIPLLVAGIGILALTWVMTRWIIGAAIEVPDPPPATLGIGLAIFGVGLLVWLVPHVDLDAVSADAGLVTLIALFALGVLLVGVGADFLAVGPPRALFAALRLQRLPIITLTLIVFIAASRLDTAPGFHKARTLGTEPVNAVFPRTAVDDWLGRCEGSHPASANECDRTVRPMFLVASSGGGARAAYWQIVVSDCIFGGQAPDESEPDGQRVCSGQSAPETVAFASGISGGSVGLTMSAVTNWQDEKQQRKKTYPGTLDERSLFEGGFLDAVVGNLVFTDVPNGFAHLAGPRDRAKALEDAWRDRIPALGEGIFATQTRQGEDGKAHLKAFPALMLNSASVEEGCRVNVSVLKADGNVEPDTSCRTLPDPHPGKSGESSVPLVATRDVSDYLCQARGDLSLATAALLSARFPFVSPSGALESCKRKGNFTFLVDGGFVDSSAASTISDLLPLIADEVRGWNKTAHPGGCVQPVVMQVDNGYSDVVRRADPSRPAELLAPLNGWQAANGGRADSERQRLARLTSELLNVGCDSVAPEMKPLPRYLHVFPVSHPGIQAPLGWALSDLSQRDLESQLYSKGNLREIACAKAWLTGSAERCPATGK